MKLFFLLLFMTFASANVYRIEVCSEPTSQDQLEEWVREWRTRLGLTDWSVTATETYQRMLKPNTLGNIHWTDENNTAIIKVMSAINYTKVCDGARSDQEVTIVHELVHLSLHKFNVKGRKRNKKKEERIVVAITAALLQLKYPPAYKPSAHIASTNSAPGKTSCRVRFFIKRSSGTRRTCRR